ncbi:MAG: hypothetical protein KGI71_05190 [Patescibacteria group bacterium]|nr:hypothetical protein [Patescibacteria group bacterium]
MNKPWYKRRRYWLHGASAMVGALAAGWSSFVGSLPGPTAAWAFVGTLMVGLNAALAMADTDDSADHGGAQ